MIIKYCYNKKLHLLFVVIIILSCKIDKIFYTINAKGVTINNILLFGSEHS